MNVPSSPTAGVPFTYAPTESPASVGESSDDEGIKYIHRPDAHGAQASTGSLQEHVITLVSDNSVPQAGLRSNDAGLSLTDHWDPQNPTLSAWLNRLASIEIAPDRLDAITHDIGPKIAEELMAHDAATLLHMCKENTRRSHLQCVASTLLSKTFGLNIENLSAGHEPKEVYPAVLDSFRDIGLNVAKLEGTGDQQAAIENAQYEVRNGEEWLTTLYSKTAGDISGVYEGRYMELVACCLDLNLATEIDGQKALHRFPFEHNDPKGPNAINDKLPTDQKQAIYNNSRDEIAAEVYQLFKVVAESLNRNETADV